MMRIVPLCFAFIVAAVVWSGCREQGTEVIFVIESDLGVPDLVNRLDLVLTAESSRPDRNPPMTNHVRLRIGPGEGADSPGFPVTYVVRAGSRYDARVWMTAEAYLDGRRVVATSGGETFSRGASRTVRLWLPADTDCPAGQVVCDANCTDARTNPRNCGWCWNECGPGEPCVAGRCECPGGRTRCGSGCADTRRDPMNCGECGNRCSGGRVCWDAACEDQCPPDLTDCGGWCVSTDFDRENCGGCGVRCPGDEACDDGSCSSRCAPRLPYGECEILMNCPCPPGSACDLAATMFGGPEPWSPSGFWVHTGPEYCKGVSGSAGPGEPCPTGAGDCQAGLGCLPNAEGDGTARCMRWCARADGAPCSPDEPCVAIAGQEAYDTSGYGVCRAGGLRLDDICNGIDDDGNAAIDDMVDIWSDPTNCGGCGITCPEGQPCVSASCMADCPDGMPLCGDGYCAGLYDPARCGPECVRCQPFHDCMYGICTPNCGTSGYAAPCPAPEGLVCTPLRFDPQNCGGCGIACDSGMGLACNDGSCSGSCPTGTTNCSGVCRPIGSDPDACADCGNSCLSMHECRDMSCLSCSPEPAPAGGECLVTSNCGCGSLEHCVLIRDTGGTVTEACVPRTGDLPEGSWCSPLVQDCAVGLLCVPHTDGRDEAYCVRACLDTEDCCTEAIDCGDTVSCDLRSRPILGYGLCLRNTPAGSVGAPCETPDNCVALPERTRVCLRHDPGGLGNPLPGGYCSQICLDDPGCPAGGGCARLGGITDRRCLRRCSTTGDCRFWEGYDCARLEDGSYCWPGYGIGPGG